MLRARSSVYRSLARITIRCCQSAQIQKPEVGPPPPDLKRPFKVERSKKDSKVIYINSKEPETCKVTQLDNGLRVSTLDYKSYTGAIGLTINTGSRYESEEEYGASIYAEKMAFKTGKKYTQGDILKESGIRGVQHDTLSTREQLFFETIGLHDDLPKMLDLLADSILYPKFDQMEFEEQKFVIAHRVGTMLDDPKQWPIELSYTAAYGDDSPMGRNNWDIEKLMHVEPETVKEFMKKWYTPSRMVVGALGVDHDRLVEQCHKLFGHLEKDNLDVNPDASVSTPYYPSPPKSEYKGGMLTMEDDRPTRVGVDLPGNFQCFSAVFIGFEACSIYSGREYYVAFILASLLGSGSSFSNGGPGKGMYSRVYREMLSNGYVESGQSIYNSHYDGGIFGLSLTGLPNYLPKMLELATSGMMRLQTITEEEFLRAKNQLIANVCSNLESAPSVLDDLLRQIQLYNTRNDYEYHIKNIRSITLDEMNAFVSKMLATKPSLITYGDAKLKDSVSYEQIEHFIKYHKK